MPTDDREPPPGSLLSPRESLRVWVPVGLNSFGGPAGQLAVIHRTVVDEHQIVDEQRYLHALNFCMLLPGPEAMQLATYLGWLSGGVSGGVIAGSAFVLPGAAFMLVISAVYAVAGDVGWVSGLLFGVQAAVIGIVAQAVIRIAGRALRSPLLVVLAGAAFVAVFLFSAPFPLVVLVALAVGWLVGRRRPDLLAATPRGQDDRDRTPPASAVAARRAAYVALALWLVPVAGLVVVLGRSALLAQQAVLFSQAAVLGFGGAYAVLAFVSQQAVQTYGWLTPSQMVTGLGLAETTPGPLILVCEFVGFVAAYQATPSGVPPLVAGAVAAAVTVWVLFLPSFAFVFLGAPYVERLRHSIGLSSALAAVTAVVVGVIADLAVWFTIHVVFDLSRAVTVGPFDLELPAPGSLDVWAAALAVVGAVLLFRVRLAMLEVLGICAVLGLLVTLAGWH